jgi:hypothetical protein
MNNFDYVTEMCRDRDVWRKCKDAVIIYRELGNQNLIIQRSNHFMEAVFQGVSPYNNDFFNDFVGKKMYFHDIKPIQVVFVSLRMK